MIKYVFIESENIEELKMSCLCKKPKSDRMVTCANIQVKRKTNFTLIIKHVLSNNETYRKRKLTRQGITFCFSL